MRLSDVKGERVLDVIADIIDPVANIAESEAAKALFSRAKLPEGEERTAFLIKRIRSTVPKLLKNHKQDILTIMAAISDKPYEEYVASMNLVSLTRDLTELLSDSVFIELFIPAQTGELSGSAQENIMAQ